MDSSSESDSYGRRRGSRQRGRDPLRGRAGRRAEPFSTSGSEAGAPGFTEKMSTLASTLQDTSKHLIKVDWMLDEYREHNHSQTEAIALLRENLKESINQRQNGGLRTSNTAASVSASTLHNSDLDPGSASDGQRVHPTSPLKDYSGAPRTRRRSHSASVHFNDNGLAGEDVHCLHQSMRDLRSNQQRLSHDLNREILQRNRSEVDTRRAMENLSEHLLVSQTQDVSCVEQLLHELGREMQSENQGKDRARRTEQWRASPEELQQALGRLQDRVQERDETVKARLLKSEREKDKIGQDLERTMRLLEQSESTRDSLLQQMEGLHAELQRARQEKTELQRVRPDLQKETSQHTGRMQRDGRAATACLDLEREVVELRAELRKASVLSEVEELTKALEHKEREQLRLSMQVEELSSELARREQQLLRMQEQLREIQSRGPAERREMEALLAESKKSKEELKSRAQAAVRQWKAKSKRLEQELEEARAEARLQTDKATQATMENEGSQGQLTALSVMTESVRRELTDVRSRLVQREEELHRRDVELSETRQRHLCLEQETREVKEASADLQEEAQRQAVLQVRLKDENQKLEEQAETQARRYQRDQDTVAELQAVMKEATSARAQLARQLTEEQRCIRELQKSMAELQARLASALEENASLGQQLQLERELHRKEMDGLKATAEGGRVKRERELQETLRICQQELNEMQNRATQVQAEAATDKELSRALNIKLDRMKDECDKLAKEVNTKEEALTLLHRKYKLLKQELEDAEAASYKELCRALNIKLDRMKEECDKLVKEVNTKEEAHTLLHRKYRILKQELEDAWLEDKQKRGSEKELDVLRENASCLEAEREMVLSSVGEELDAACRGLEGGAEYNLQVISQRPGLVKDPHRWLAETKMKLRWLCQEVKERETREQRLRKQHQETRDQLSDVRQSKDSEQSALLQRLDEQEKLLHSLSKENKELLERSRRKEEVTSLQGTREALDHLESMPDKSCLMDNFKDLEESQRQREAVQRRYTQKNEIVQDLQHRLDESRRRMEEYRDEKLDATSKSQRLAAFSSSIRGTSGTASGLLGAHILSPYKRLTSTDLDVCPINGAKTFKDPHVK